MNDLHAGAAVADITPHDAQFLFGYPYVHRYATGVNDRLYSSALYLTDGHTPVVFIANDIIFVTRQITQRIRAAIFEATGIPGSNVVVTATHTHSTPTTVDYLSNADDRCVPPVDLAYLAFFESRVVEAAVAAIRGARPARAGLVVANAKGVGTNRRDPQGPADPEAPTLVVKARGSDETIGVMLVYSMHPTVLREDSSIVSADFPGMARRYLQQSVFNAEIPVLHHTGPAGNQSPRHVISGTTVAEAERLGVMLGHAVERALPGITYRDDLQIACAQSFLDLPTRGMPPIEEAERSLTETAARLAELRASREPWQIVRKAEVDWFGAAETVTLSRAAQDGRLEATAAACLPAEVQVVKIGPWAFAAWPGELFVEYGLAAKRERPGLYVISLANGELQGYIATEQAVAEGGYEATNCLFAPVTGQLFVDETLRLLGQLGNLEDEPTA